MDATHSNITQLLRIVNKWQGAYGSKIAFTNAAVHTEPSPLLKTYMRNGGRAAISIFDLEYNNAKPGYTNYTAFA